MKSILITSCSVALILCIVWLQTPDVTAYSYKKRELHVRTTAYTHSESDHIEYGRKTALGTNLKCTREYNSAASDWSRFPVGTEFRIKGINRHFVIDDYGSALLGKDTIDIYFTSKRDMNRWGVQHVDIIITKYGDYEKSREILSQRTRYSHCRKMLAEIEKNGKNSTGGEKYEPVPDVPEDIDTTLMAAASIPKKEWEMSPPEVTPDPRQPEIVPEQSEVLFATAEPDLTPVRKIRRFKEIFAGSFQTVGRWRMNSRQTGELNIPVSLPRMDTPPPPLREDDPIYKPVRKKRKFRPL